MQGKAVSGNYHQYGAVHLHAVNRQRAYIGLTAVQSHWGSCKNQTCGQIKLSGVLRTQVGTHCLRAYTCAAPVIMFFTAPRKLAWQNHCSSSTHYPATHTCAAPVIMFFT